MSKHPNVKEILRMYEDVVFDPFVGLWHVYRLRKQGCTIHEHRHVYLPTGIDHDGTLCGDCTAFAVVYHGWSKATPFHGLLLPLALPTTLQLEDGRMLTVVEVHASLIVHSGSGLTEFSLGLPNTDAPREATLFSCTSDDGKSWVVAADDDEGRGEVCSFDDTIGVDNECY